MEAKTFDYNLVPALGWILFSTAAVPLWRADPYAWTHPMLLMMLIANGVLAVGYVLKRTTVWAGWSGALPLFCGVACGWLLDHHH